MFKILLIGITLILFVGVIRRWFFQGAWRLIIPLIVGFFIGVPLAAAVVGSGAPAAVIIIAPIFAGLIITSALKSLLDDITRPSKKE